MQTQTHAELTGEIPHVGFHANGSKQSNWHLSRPSFPDPSSPLQLRSFDELNYPGA